MLSARTITTRHSDSRYAIDSEPIQERKSRMQGHFRNGASMLYAVTSTV